MDALRLADIVARLGGKLVGDGERSISRVAALEVAGPDEIAFLAHPKYRSQLAATRAGAVILAASAAADCPVDCIVSEQPYVYFARLSQWLNPPRRGAAGCHVSACVESPLPASVSVSAGAVIGRACRIGERVDIGPNSVVGDGVTIGADTRIYASVTVYPGVVIGERAIIHGGVVIGADGFGFAREGDGSWVKIPQVGGVFIGNDVEIGAGTTIDRGALDDTVIEDGVKLDNQIQIGHNVRIGAHSAFAGCVGVAGSARIGQRCTVGGAAVILGHLSIADDVNISAGTLVSKSIHKPGTYTATVPSLEHGEWLRNFSHLRHLDALADKIRSLETALAHLTDKEEK